MSIRLLVAALALVAVAGTDVAFAQTPEGTPIRVRGTIDSLDGNQSVVTIHASGLTAAMVSEMARWGRDIQANGEQLTLTVHNEASIPEITRYLVAQGANVFAISPSRLSLEDIFIETVGKDGGL